MKSYALWELRTNNLIRDFDNEHDALALALRFIERNGPESIANLSLTVEDEQGDGELIAYGQALVERARRELASEQVAG
jgi:hypothetical protein